MLMILWLIIEVGCVAGEGNVGSQDLPHQGGLPSEAPCLTVGESSRVSQSKLTAGLLREMHRPNVVFLRR